MSWWYLRHISIKNLLADIKRIEKTTHYSIIVELIYVCLKKNEHSNIEKQLINVDIEQMSWLSSYKISKSENENNNKNENENENIDYLIFHKKDLKRNSNLRITSNISNQFWILIVKRIKRIITKIKIQTYFEICTFFIMLKYHIICLIFSFIQCI